MIEVIRTAATFGEQLRQWRQHRRMSQLALAMEADISPRHLSFVETGRSQPSRELVLRLVQRLDVPLRERNGLLIAAGYAPMYPQRALDDPALAAARGAVQRVLEAHEPHPALAIDRHWNMVMANRMVAPLLAAAAPRLLEPPVNVLRLSLHREGLAGSILNLDEWRSHLFERLHQQIAVTADPRLADLLAELRALDAGEHREGAPASPDRHAPQARHGGANAVGGTGSGPALAVPLRMATPAGTLALISTTTIFGSPVDVTLSELAIEAFFPADEQTAERLRALHDAVAVD